MIELLLHWLASLVKSRRRLEAENLVLRHQVNILRRRASRRLWLSNADRLAFVWLYRLCPSVVDAVAIIRPETVIHRHRQGFKAFWRWKSGSRGGRPAIPKEIRDLIREMSRANWLWGAPRIHTDRLGIGRSCHQGRDRPQQATEDMGEAIALFEEASRLDPNSGKAQAWLARALFNDSFVVGQFVESSARAVEAATRALALDDPEDWTESVIAMVLAKRGDLHTAEVHLNRALARNPTTAFTLEARGYIYVWHGHAAEALQIGERLLRLDPLDQYHHLFLIEFPTQPNREKFRRNREQLRRNREFSFGISEPLHACRWRSNGKRIHVISVEAFWHPTKEAPRSGLCPYRVLAQPLSFR